MNLTNKLSAINLWKSYSKKFPINTKIIYALTLTYPLESILNPIIFSNIVKSIENTDYKKIIKYLIYFAIVNVTTTSIYNIDTYITEDMNIKLISHIIDEVMKYLFEVKKENVDTMKNGEIITKIKLYSQLMSTYINTIRNNILPNIIAMLFQSIYLYTIDPFLGFIILMMLFTILITLYNLCMQTQHNQNTNDDTNLYENIDEVLLNFSTIINHDGYEKELKKFNEQSIKFRATKLKKLKCSLKITTAMNFIISILGILFTIRIYSKFMSTSPDSTGNASACITVLFEALNITKDFSYSIYNLSNEYTALNNLHKYFDNMKEGKNNFEETGGPAQRSEGAYPKESASVTLQRSVSEGGLRPAQRSKGAYPKESASETRSVSEGGNEVVFDTRFSAGLRPNEVSEGGNEVSKDLKNGGEYFSSPQLKITNLFFKYGNGSKNTLNNLSFSINKGDRVAIIGPNGCGKSTLIKLIMKYIKPISGEIYLNMKSYSDLPPEEVRKNIGYATQSCVLFDNTIEYNILYSNSNMTKPQLEQKIKDFGLFSFFSQFKDGLDTYVGKQGNKLSGGQKQIIQLVRILVQNPEIIILDEITSNIDVENKNIIKNIIKFYLISTTIIFITHDQDLLLFSNNIINLEDGRDKN
jgi:ABC-type multidrug transport system fused ATPase/permease subunit